jgi:hypothetical protein
MLRVKESVVVAQGQDNWKAVRERSAGLLEMAVNELESLDIVDVQLTPIVKAKPAPSTNQLGTLSQAQAVAA